MPASERQIAAANAAIKRNPERHRARLAVKGALRSGRLLRGRCLVSIGCAGRMEAHHDDYAKPLEVLWLCRRHHLSLHRTQGLDA